MKSNRSYILHPATLFFILTGIIIFLSWVFEIYGLSVVMPQTGEVVQVQSVLSAEGIRWLLRHIVTNFTEFAPLGMVVVAMLGIGVAQHSGFVDACIRRSNCSATSFPRRVIIWTIALGLISNAIGDAGYIILLPISATLFRAAGLSPITGVITAYVSVACGYSANVVISTMDPLISRVTEEAAIAGNINYNSVGPLSNYYFMCASTLLIAFIIYKTTRKFALRDVDFSQLKHPLEFTKSLSHKESRALSMAIMVGVIYLLFILFSTFSSFGILRGVGGNLMRSPFIMGVLFLISLGAGLIGMIYGFSSGRYRSDKDVIEGLIQPMRILGVYFVIAFFAAQMFACFSYSKLDYCFTILLMNLISGLEISSLPYLLLFILLCGITNLIMVSATSKWGFIAFIFLPIFASQGVAPEIVQSAYRIGDSSTNAITPFLFYMPLALSYMLHYDKHTSYFSLLKRCLPYTIAVLIGWTLFFVIWFISRLPFGL